MRGKPCERAKVIELLRPILKLGLSVNKACTMAGLAQSTVATWVKDDIELRLKISVWQHEPELYARKSIVKRLKTGDLKVSMWWMEKHVSESIVEDDAKPEVDDNDIDFTALVRGLDNIKEGEVTFVRQDGTKSSME